MSKAALKELAAHLAQRHGLAREEAERFLTQFQDLIDEVLSREKLVKVKGLGTFKVQSVSARKSVDVNTGEAIEISGREKVSYLPDTAMRDLVNRPFSAFETVVLNEDVDLSDLDEESPEVSQPDDMAPESFQSEDVIPEDTAESMEINTEGQFQTDRNNEQGGEDLISDTDLPQASSSTLTADTPLASTTEVSSATLQTPLPKLINNTNKMKMQQQMSEQEIQEKWTEARICAENRVLSSANELLHSQVSHLKRLINVLVIVATVLLLLFIGASVYVFDQLKLRDERIEILLTQVHQARAKTVAPAEKEKKLEKNITGQDKAKPATTSPTSQKAEPSMPTVAPKETPVQVLQISSQDTKKATETTRDTQYDKDPRIRTGAYNIIGIDQVVVVRKGQTLKSISRFYLGPDMECYVEALNGGVKEVTEGQKVKIPKLKIRKK